MVTIGKLEDFTKVFRFLPNLIDRQKMQL